MKHHSFTKCNRPTNYAVEYGAVRVIEMLFKKHVVAVVTITAVIVTTDRFNDGRIQFYKNVNFKLNKNSCCRLLYFIINISGCLCYYRFY